MKTYNTIQLGLHVVVMTNSINEAARIAAKIKGGKIEYHKQFITEATPMIILNCQAVAYASKITKSVFMKQKSGQTIKFE